MKSAFFILIAIGMAFSFTEPTDSLSLEKRIGLLERKVDSLQVALARYSMKEDHGDLFFSEKAINWGSGATIQIHINGKTWGLDAGYTFVTKKFLKMGLVYGGEITLNDVDIPRGAFYGKTSLGTPVFLNFVSMESYFKLLVYPAGGNFHYHIPEHTRGGAAAGFDIGFWITPHIALLAGAGQNFGSGHLQYPFEQIGVRYTFNKSKKKYK